MKGLRLVISIEYQRCLSSQGEWDGTWDDSYAYIIFDSDNVLVDNENGFATAEKAREWGERRIKALETMRL